MATVGDAFGGFGILVDNATLVPESGYVFGLIAVGAASVGYTLKRKKQKY